MKKLYLLTLTLILTLTVNSQNFKIKQQLTTGSKVISENCITQKSFSKAILKTFNYDNGEISSGIGVRDTAYVLGTYIELPTDILKISVNKTIDIIRIGIDDKTIISSAIIEIYEDSLKGTPILAQQIDTDSITKGWNLFTLDAGYLITENKTLFIGILIETNEGGYTQTYDTDPTSYPQFSGHTVLNGEYYGTLFNKIGIDADYNIQALITDGQGVNFADLAIIDIQPSSTNCKLDTSEILTAIVTNRGKDTFEGEFNLMVTINDKIITQQVTPTVIKPNEEKRINLPKTNMSNFGVYHINATIDVPDTNPENNNYTTILHSGDATLSITLLTDGFPNETSWKLLDNRGNIIANNGFLESETEYVNNICIISDSCYTWEIYDTYGDGLSGEDTVQGLFTIAYNDSIIATSPANGDFGYKYRVSGIGNGCLINDIAITEATIPTYEISGYIDISGIIYNNGTDTLKSFDVQFNIDDYSSSTYKITDIAIPNGEIYEFKHDVPFNFDSEKEYEIQIICENPNGEIDEFPIDNSIEHKIIINSNVIQKKQLIEHFTSSTNDACFNYNPLMDELLSNNFDNYSLIRYQVNWPGVGDDYYIEQTSERIGIYNVANIPSVYRNGRYDLDYSQEGFNNYADQKTVINISATGEYHNNIAIKATINSIINNVNNLTAYIAIIENSTTNNVGTNGENEFYNVLMQMLPDAKGTAIPELKIDSSFVLNASYDMTTTFVEDMADLSAVIFVQNDSTKEVLQSTTVSIKLADNILQNRESDYLIYPNPFLNSISIGNLGHNNKIILSNTIGQVIYTKRNSGKEETIKTENLKKGVYLLTINDNNGVVNVTKLIKQ